MIPKIIHYCWFGGKKMPQNLKKYINEWREIMPDYEIIEWNEDRFDVNSVRWTKDAYKDKKFAFVADYVRMYALINYGGIYLDTDVQVLKRFDPYLKLKSFMSFEGDDNLIGTAVIGAEKNTSFLKSMMDFYHTHSFDCEQLGSLQNTTVLQTILLTKGLKLNNQRQSVYPDIELFPMEYFSAKIVKRDEYHITNNTTCIHQYNMSWFNKRTRLWIKFTNMYIKPIKRFLGLMPKKYQ